MRYFKLMVFRRIAAAYWASLIIIGALYVYNLGFEWAKPEQIRDSILSAGYWGPLMYILCNIIRPFFLFPAIILGVAGGLAFGPFWGTVYLIIGTVIGAVLCFVLARQIGHESFNQRWPKWIPMDSLENHAECHGFRTMVILRLVPILPWDAISFIAGFSKVKFGPYVFATLVGSVPGAIAFCYFGNALFRLQPMDMLVAVIIVIMGFGIRTVSRSLVNKN